MQETNNQDSSSNEDCHDYSKPTFKVEDPSFTYVHQTHLNHDLTVEREQSLTIALKETPGGDRAIVVDSDYENNKYTADHHQPNTTMFYERRQSVDAEDEEKSDAANADVTVQPKIKEKLGCCFRCSKTF